MVLQQANRWAEAAKWAPAECGIWDAMRPTYRCHQGKADARVLMVREFWPEPTK